VVKVESTRRPDGARRGPARFFSRLNGGKASVALDLTSTVGRQQLGELVAGADVVITGSRPRALEQLGLDPEEAVAGGRTRLWLSITGYGTEGGSGTRVAFGDDAAVAGGLVARDRRGPCFLADAVADPLCGLASAVAALGALADGGAWVLDASMADIAGGLTGPAVAVSGPTPRPAPAADDGWATEARALGADTAAVLSSLARP
jgi:crotonobetainyl-CoA:carnitine CoA-transferase CaiB-like acyl-CoA transferase